jgi:hypothetical protein
MVCRIRTATGVTEVGMNVLRTTTKFYRDHFPNVHAVWLTSFSGELGTHVLVVDFPSMAAIEELEARLAVDAGWAKIWKEAGPGPFWSSWRDEYYNTV